MKILDKKFNHHSWFKGGGLTRKEAMKSLASIEDIYLSKKLSKKQSNNLFDKNNYDDVLTDGHSSYKLTQEEKDYYIKCKNIYKEIKKEIDDNWIKCFDTSEALTEYYQKISQQYKNSIIDE